MSNPTGQVPEQTPALWPSSIYGMRHATVADIQRRAEAGWPVAADGDTLAIMRGDLNRITDTDLTTRRPMTIDAGFDQHDLDHMDDEGSTVHITYAVVDRHGNTTHATDIKVDGPAFAAALRPIANPGPQD